MDRRHRKPQRDTAPLALAALGLAFLALSAVVTFTTPTRYTETVPPGPRLEITATYPVPRPAVGEECYRAGAAGVSGAGPVTCRIVADELRWALAR